MTRSLRTLIGAITVVLVLPLTACSAGPVGDAGPQGPAGEQGSTGPQGAEGEMGSGDSALFHALMPGDNAATVAVGKPAASP